MASRIHETGLAVGTTNASIPAFAVANDGFHASNCRWFA
jgi:hypothetical protein